MYLIRTLIVEIHASSLSIGFHEGILWVRSMLRMTDRLGSLLTRTHIHTHPVRYSCMEYADLELHALSTINQYLICRAAIGLISTLDGASNNRGGQARSTTDKQIHTHTHAHTHTRARHASLDATNHGLNDVDLIAERPTGIN